MPARDWQWINSVFEAALALPEGERAAYVEQVCRGSPETEDIVLRLLADDAQSTDDHVSAKSPPVLNNGERLGERLRIVRFIARGGMGEVYEAYDEKLKAPVAVKTLSSDLMLNPDAVARFRREIRIARELRHENLCAVYDLFEHHDAGSNCVRPCLTMQLVEGETLSQYLMQHRPMRPSAALQIARQVADALDALHGQGVIHRDLKPANIMLTDKRGNTRIVVTDFGLAKVLGGTSDLFESRLEAQPGSPYFMAPELLAARGTAGIASDIYAFGLILDEMVTASRAFPAGSQAALFYAKLCEGPVRPRQRGLSAPRWEPVILRCLNNEPARRYQSARAVMADLERRRPLGWLVSRRAVTAGAVGLAIAGILTITASALPPVTTMLVFPIENQTSSGEYSYLCSGTTAELLRRLSKLQNVHIIPYYEPKPTSPARLKGRFSLHGLMQGYQRQIRLTMQLIDNERGELVWSESFDRQHIDNPLELQSDIALSTVDALTAHALLGQSKDSIWNGAVYSIAQGLRRSLSFQRPGDPPTVSAAALDLYMRGRHLVDDMSLPSAQAAIQLFENAIAEDPGFALAYSALADVQIVLMEYNYMPDEQCLSRARGFAEQAVRRGPKMPEAHASLAVVEQNSWRWEDSERSYLESLRLNPRFARARRWYAGLILQFGRLEEALEQVRLAMEMDPYDYSAYPGYGLYLFCAGRNDEAIAVLERGLAEKPLLTTRHNLGNVYAKLGSISSGALAARYFQKAMDQADKVAEAESATDGRPRGIGYSDRMYALYFALAGRSADAQPYLEKLTADMETGHTSPVVIAWIHTALGRYESALGLLERALSVRDRKLLNIKVHPLLEPLRNMERFRTVLRIMRL